MKRYGVRRSVPAWAHSRKPAAAGLLQQDRRAGNIDQLLQQRRANAGSATQSAYVQVADHSLVIFCCVRIGVTFVRYIGQSLDTVLTTLSNRHQPLLKAVLKKYRQYSACVGLLYTGYFKRSDRRPSPPWSLKADIYRPDDVQRTSTRPTLGAL